MTMRSDSEPGLTRTQRARQADIVDAAIAILDREGFAAASVERIAAEAGTTKSTVLYHFKTKEAIYEAVVVTLFQAGAAYMTERIMAADSRPDKLHAYLSSNLSFIAEHAAHVNAVHRIQENAGPSGDGSDAVTPLAHLLASGQETGEFGSHFDPEVMALAIRAIVDGASFHFTAHPGLDVPHYVDEAIQLFDRATAP
ncbi:TetR/AcrR family transcriptional regulator [Diaminobutyricibacter tongyongensis]|uniref:TetR/AcrR family transcriptional regulator n=2 Tax=Leifsonia tongyongensis TaxID=1268043 RepID=A0A6L9Y150_9MICO|nr:TetR/AcrR family transcriptional regulator [Diaminobutyricibacter tongyongensis]